MFHQIHELRRLLTLVTRDVWSRACTQWRVSFPLDPPPSSRPRFVASFSQSATYSAVLPTLRFYIAWCIYSCMGVCAAFYIFELEFLDSSPCPPAHTSFTAS